MTIHPNGIGASLGDDLVTQAPLQTTGTVYYVHGSTGDDANSGTNRNAPKATLASANTAASSGDIVVLLDGHAETITSVVAIKAGLTVVGEGQSAGKPTVKLTNNQANGNMLTLGADSEIRNIWFEEDAQANADSVVSTNQADRIGIIGCYFESDGNSTCPLEVDTSDDIRIINCTLISTATDDGSRSTYGLFLTGGGARITLDGTVFDAGSVGWDATALDCSGSAWTFIRGTGVSLLRGASMTWNTSSTGWIIPSTTSGNAYITGLD